MAATTSDLIVLGVGPGSEILTLITFGLGIGNSSVTGGWVMRHATHDRAASWELWLCDPNGNRITLLDDVIEFSLARVVNEIGAFSITLPGAFDEGLLRLDGMVEFWRAPQDGVLQLVTVGFLRRFFYHETGQGSDAITVSGFDANYLLDGRIVAYAAGSAQSSQSGNADDLMKAIVRQNLGSSATAARDLSGLEFDVDADTGAGPALVKSFAWRNVLRVLQDIAEASRQLGTPLYFDVLPKLVSQTRIGFDFRTFTDRRGSDHGYSSGSPVFFSKEFGNLTFPELEYDYGEERNYVYAGGQGEEAEREIQEVEDASRSGASSWNRRELFVDARNEATTSGVLAAARAGLEEKRPRVRFSGSLLDSRQARFGLDWNFGDTVVMRYRHFEADADITAVKLSVNPQGQEAIEASVEVSI